MRIIHSQKFIKAGIKTWEIAAEVEKIIRQRVEEAKLPSQDQKQMALLSVLGWLKESLTGKKMFDLRK